LKGRSSKHDAGRDVLHRALQRKTDRETGGAENRDDAGRLDAQLRQRTDDRNHANAPQAGVAQDGAQCGVHARLTRE
jgi:hypothetical protein